jgi:hypothetical protein
LQVQHSWHVVVVLSFACVPLTASSARAEGTQYQQKVNEARTACLTGDVTKGVRLLAELFVDSQDPTHIFNQGRCFEQNGHHRAAIDRFRDYLRVSPGLGEADVALVNQHIAPCQGFLDAPPSRATKTSTRPVGTGRIVAAAQTTQRAPGAGLRTAGVLVASLGAAALVTGLVLNLKVNSMAKDLEAPGAYSRSTDDRRGDYMTLAWVGYGVGGTLVASGALIYYLGWAKARAGKTSVALIPAPGQVGVVLRGGF